MHKERTLNRWAPVGIALILIVGVAATRQQGSTIGLVNIPAVLEQTPGYQQALETFQQEFQPASDEIEQMAAELDSLIQEYNRQSVVLSPTAKQEKEAELSQLEQRFQARRQELGQRSADRERELVAPLETRVRAVIDGIRAERNLSLVFDIGGQGATSIVSADPTLDLTLAIVERLRQSPQ